MCGIAGTINLNLTNEILSTISHRGPDSNGLFDERCYNHHVFLGQTRLSIVDLSEAGMQPMTDSSGSFTLIFNGEIYNHAELRKELKEIQFKGHSDTETILYYLAKFGMDAIKNLNGIFAIAFFDRIKEKLYLARDPFGIKPLYYCFKNNTLAFSSEIRVVAKFIDKKEINLDCLYTYMRLRFCPSPLTLIKDVNKLEPGHYITFDCTNEVLNSKTTFYSYIPEKNYNITEGEALEQYDYLIRKAVKKQLMSDVPIAIMLSGGVDSALLTHLAQKESGEKFDSFTVGFGIKTSANELQEAAVSAKWLGTRHHEIIITENIFKQNSGNIINMIEEPIGSQSIVPFLYLSEEIHKKGFKVALSGQGIDECWAGYGRYNFQNFFEKYSSPKWNILNLGNKFIKSDKIRRGIDALCEKDREKRFIESYSFFEKKTIQKMMLSSILFSDGYDDRLISLIKQKSKLYNTDQLDALDFMLTLDSRMALSEDLLLYTDKLSMQNSLEVRVPFLDIELMQFIESLSNKYKSGYLTNKILHKKLSEKYLPKEIIYRKKRGFQIPRKEWYKTESGNALIKELNEENEVFYSLFHKQPILGILKKHQTNQYNYEDQIYSIMNLFYWIKQNL